MERGVAVLSCGDLLRVSSEHTSEDNMAATDRNLLLELSIKANRS